MNVHSAHASKIANPRTVGATPVKVVAPAPPPGTLSSLEALRALRSLDPALATQGITTPEGREPNFEMPAQPVHPQVEALMKAWGTDDPAFDLNGDGVVDLNDLLLMLQKLADQPTDITEPPTTETPIADPDPPMTVDGLIDAWGSDPSAYDINGDGTVNLNDLLALLQQMANEPQGAPAGPATPPPTEIVTKSADQLIENFRAQGFTEAPPTNLSDILGSLDLGANAKRAFMAKLASAYPHGLGVQLLG